MYGRGLFGVLVVIVVAAVAGIAGYNMGLAQGVVESGRAVAPVGYYGFGFFPFFGFLFPLLFLFLIFGLLRAAFWRGPSSHGHMRGWGAPIEDWHRRAHAEGAAREGGAGTDQPPPERSR